jgi:hypothetical protein
LVQLIGGGGILMPVPARNAQQDLKVDLHAE